MGHVDRKIRDILVHTQVRDPGGSATEIEPAKDAWAGKAGG